MKSCCFCGADGHDAKDCEWPKPHNSKLTVADVKEIRALCEEREHLEDRLAALSDPVIADVFGVSKQTIRDIRLGYTWPKVD